MKWSFVFHVRSLLEGVGRISWCLPFYNFNRLRLTTNRSAFKTLKRLFTSAASLIRHWLPKETRQYRHCLSHPLKVSGISRGIPVDLSPGCFGEKALGSYSVHFSVLNELECEKGIWKEEALMTPSSISFGHQDGFSGKQIKIWCDF